MTHGGGGFLATVAMWQVMVVVMMTPTVLPWLRAYATLVAPTPAARSLTASVPFGVGYVLVWLGYSVAMAALQTALASAGLLVGDRLTAVAGALVLIGAGAFQFAPLKAACLTHCRNPLTYFLARWKDGAVSGLRLGVAHGAYCLGCCWALMLTALALGAMDVRWMAVLTVLVVLEQRAPGGVWLGRGFGVALAGYGLWRLA
jgi:predicted metal-binding membrane protein